MAFPVVPTKVVEPVTKVIAQLVKPARVPSKYPCIICSSFKHHLLIVLERQKFKICSKLNQTLLLL